ncbi:MAG TPA: tetratricopeptide repeat protein [Bryobacteraceae bacterium]|nr:tetratricopeptide repeat protein [Bryobacteraceae bacterium]
MRLLLALLMAGWPSAGQVRIDSYDRNIHTAVIKSGHIILQRGKITAPAPEEPVIAERVPNALLDTPAPVPFGATIRQVLSNTADGTPGEEVLENRSFFDALKPIVGQAPLPNALKFATEEHGTLGWFSQEYAGERMLWSHGPSVLLIRIPGKNLTLVVSGDTPVEAGNIVRSDIALTLFKDVVGLQVSQRDEWIAQALAEFHRGNREASAQLVHQALEKFPELESAPDVSLLYLFAQLRLPETEASATAVIREHPSLPTAWFYYGEYLENSKRYREAAACFEKITMHQPPWHNWTVAAAKKELTYLKTY